MQKYAVNIKLCDFMRENCKNAKYAEIAKKCDFWREKCDRVFLRSLVIVKIYSGGRFLTIRNRVQCIIT